VNQELIKINSLYKEYVNDGVVTKVLFDLNFVLEKGEFMTLMGPSGSGKSTLMHILGFLDRLSTGDYIFNAKEVNKMNDDELALMRLHEVGFVFQSFNLLAKSTVLDNVILPTLYARMGSAERERRAKEVLDKVGLSHRLDHLSNQLSGGEKQRVAIARALVNDPSVIFADEPTGNLDSKSTNQVMKILQDLNLAGKTIIMVTHEPEMAEYTRRIIKLRDGRIQSDEPAPFKRITLESKIK